MKHHILRGSAATLAVLALSAASSAAAAQTLPDTGVSGPAPAPVPSPAPTPAPPPSVAAQSEQPGASNGGTTALGDIIVTAQKREQRLQDVPVSITAIQGKQIEQMNITDLRSIQAYVPNLAILNSGVNPVVYIRGFGSGPNNVAFDQEVSVYSDGIYGGRGAQFSAPFFDLERMEVLRGPQGALFGRNTAAGAISLVSAKPGDHFEGYVTGGYDVVRNGWDASGVVSGPITDTFGARLAVKATDEDGYIKNLANGDEDPKERDQLARLTLVWRPSDDTDISAKAEYGHHLLRGGVTVSGSLTQPTDFQTDGSDRYVGPDYAGANQDERSGITSWNGEITGNTKIGADTLTAIAGYSHFTTQRFTAYDERNPDGTIAPDGGNALYGNGFPERFTQWSGELRLSSPTKQFFEYVVGAYVDHSNYHLHQDTYYQDIAGFISGHQSTDFFQKGTSYSFYGQGTANFTQTLRLIAGVRYSHTGKDGFFTSQTVSGTQLNPIGPNVSGSIGEHYLDPSGTLQYDLVRHVMLYATIARGSKSGGFVSNTYGVTAAGFEYKPERSTNYEAGIKSTLLNGRATLNLSVFNTVFTDLQQSVYDPQIRTFFTRNAAKARSRGVELEGQLLPTSSLALNASVAYLDAKFLNYPGAPCLATDTVAQCDPTNPASIAAHNDKGLPLQFAPKWSGSVGGTYHVDFGDYRLTTGLTGQFRSKYYIADGYSPIWGLQDGWFKLDGRIQFGPQADRWHVAVVGRNLTDRHTVGSAIQFPGSITATARSINWMDEYRSVLVEATVRF